MVRFEGYTEGLKRFVVEWESSRDYIEAHTSGSTGAPKPIRLPKSDMIVSARATNTRFGIDSLSRLHLPLSIDYIAGKMMAVRAIEAGCLLTVQKPSNTIEFEGYAHLLPIVPSQADSLIADKSMSRRVGAVIVGGAMLDSRRAGLLAEAGYTAFRTYGMTETCSHVAMSRPDDPTCLYEAMPGVTFGSDGRGCLVIKAPAYSFGELVTNDMVELADKTHFRWLGRYDNVINSGGIKIMPEQVERQLEGVIDVPYYVTGAPDGKWGETVAVVMECDYVHAARLEAAVMAAVADSRIRPRRIVAVERMERTASGKIIRKKIF